MLIAVQEPSTRAQSAVSWTTRLIVGGKEVLIAHGKRLTFPKVKLFGIVMNQLWLWGTGCLSAGLCNPIKGDKPATHESSKVVCQ